MKEQFKQKRIAVLCGGVSQEREVSLRSGDNVYRALLGLGYDVVKVDPRESQLDASVMDVAFLALHGPDYEDGKIQALLQSNGIAYTGCGVESSLIGMDKFLTKSLCHNHGIPVPDFLRLTQPLMAVPEGFSFPLMVKPLSEGSSIDVFLVESLEELRDKTQELALKYGTYLLEAFIDGQELTVGIVDAPDAVALPILELKTQRRFYDYEAKYTQGLTEFILPARLSETAETRVKQVALELYKACACKGMARVDFMYNPEQGPFVLEINTIPGLTDLSDLPAQAKEHGWSFETLVELILMSAVGRMR